VLYEKGNREVLYGRKVLYEKGIDREAWSLQGQALLGEHADVLCLAVVGIIPLATKVH